MWVIPNCLQIVVCFTHFGFWNGQHCKSGIIFQHNSYMNTTIRIQTPGLLTFGQFLKKLNKRIKKKNKGKNELQGFWFSTYFFGYL